MLRLQNKVALITGGTTGIGAATAKLFQKEGATVVVTGLNPATLANAGYDMPGVEVLASDVGDTNAISALMVHIRDHYGRIDTLFVNAAMAGYRPASAVDEDFFDRMFNTNVRGPFFLIQQAAPLIPDGGSIVLNGSVAASRGAPMATVYGATKAALRSMGRTFAAEFAPRHIRVNTVSPHLIDTPIVEKVGFTAEQLAQALEAAIATTPLRRQARVEEVSPKLCCFWYRMRRPSAPEARFSSIVDPSMCGTG
jgi:NAD(P)-dependent dehydrogenase (short-subunit alcohol dehydrogenase family)